MTSNYMEAYYQYIMTFYWVQLTLLAAILQTTMIWCFSRSLILTFLLTMYALLSFIPIYMMTYSNIWAKPIWEYDAFALFFICVSNFWYFGYFEPRQWKVNKKYYRNQQQQQQTKIQSKTELNSSKQEENEKEKITNINENEEEEIEFDEKKEIAIDLGTIGYDNNNNNNELLSQHQKKKLSKKQRKQASSNNETVQRTRNSNINQSISSKSNKQNFDSEDYAKTTKMTNNNNKQTKISSCYISEWHVKLIQFIVMSYLLGYLSFRFYFWQEPFTHYHEMPNVIPPKLCPNSNFPQISINKTLEQYIENVVRAPPDSRKYLVFET